MITCTLIFIQIPAVHVVGNLVWFHPEFMLKHLGKMIDKKLVDQARSFRQQYLTQRSGQDLARYQIEGFTIFEGWILIRNAVDLSVMQYAIYFDDKPVPIVIFQISVLKVRHTGL